jgi:hypothetical protein
MAHLHEVKDADTHYIIDPLTMIISNANGVKNKLQQGNHNSEIYTFELPKVIEGHEMSLCDKVEIHFINNSTNKADKSGGVYVVKDMHVDETESDKLLFTFVMDGAATKYNGSLWLRILFACTSDGVYTYKKWTEIFKDIIVGEGFENTTGIIEENTDLLVAWKAELEAKITNNSVSEERIAAAVKAYMEANGNTSNEAKGRLVDVSLPASAWEGETSPYTQVVTIEGITANSQVDLTPSDEQLEIFREKELAFTTKNVGGVVTVSAVGQKPQNDYVIQATITEVYYE